MSYLPEVSEFNVCSILAFLRNVLSYCASIQPTTKNCSLNVKMKTYKFANSTSLENLVRITEYWLK